MKPFWWDKIVKAFFPTLLKNGVMYCWGCQEYWEQEEKKHTSPPWAIFLLPPCKQQELGSQQPVQGSGPPRQGSLERGGMWWKPGEPLPLQVVQGLLFPHVHQACTRLGGSLGTKSLLQVTVCFKRFAFDIMWPESFGAWSCTKEHVRKPQGVISLCGNNLQGAWIAVMVHCCLL